MSLLSDDKLINRDFTIGIELLNLQEVSKVEQIFLRILEYETRIRTEPELKNRTVFTEVELQKLRSVLNKVETPEQVTNLLNSSGLKIWMKF